MDSKPSPFLNRAYTVLAPSPEVSVHDLEVAYASHVDQEEPSLLNCIWATPDSGSVATIVRVTLVDVVVAAPLLITMDPVGGVVSAGGCRIIVSE